MRIYLLVIAATIAALVLVSGSGATFESPLPVCDAAAHNTCMAACDADYLTCCRRCPWPQHCPTPTLWPTPTPEVGVRAGEAWRVWLPVMGR